MLQRRRLEIWGQLDLPLTSNKVPVVERRKLGLSAARHQRQSRKLCLHQREAGAVLVDPQLLVLLYRPAARQRQEEANRCTL